MDDGTFDCSGQFGWIVEYGATRLGALFLKCYEERRAIAFANEFLPREVFCSAHLIRIFAQQLCAGEYYWQFDRLEIVVATHFLHIFQPILTAAGAHLEEGLAALLGHDPDTHIGYFFYISDLLKRLMSSPANK
ncbi:hypothetical protein AAVH_39714 [Aphelenchoides avenae]|nr:hypothetical protein AAVH_39714 [Aphelenchus avenae]